MPSRLECSFRHLRGIGTRILGDEWTPQGLANTQRLRRVAGAVVDQRPNHRFFARYGLILYPWKSGPLGSINSCSQPSLRARGVAAK